MLKIYGSMQCPDCVRCLKDLDSRGVQYVYLDFSDSLRNLKSFLAIRDSNPLFADIKAKGSIGIPCIVKEDGTVILEWDPIM